MTEKPLMEFQAHLDGRNAHVAIWPDRLEWSRKSLMGRSSKLGLGVATAGLSLLATGVSAKTRESDVLATRSITGVSTFKRGVSFTGVRIQSSGGALELGKLTKAKAQEAQQLLMSLAGQPAPSGHTGAGSAADELGKLAELHRAGALTDEEFAAHKAKLL